MVKKMRSLYSSLRNHIHKKEKFNDDNVIALFGQILRLFEDCLVLARYAKGERSTPKWVWFHR